MTYQLHHGDCLEVMASMADNSVDAVVTDPPYFKVKSEWWDRQWDKPAEFLAWLDRVAEHWERLLKPNGSLYCFASPKMAARVEMKLGERFNVLNNIRWYKSNGNRNWSAEKEKVRSYLPNTESIIFCEHYGADNLAKGEAGYEAKCDELRGFVFEPLRAYLDGERRRAGAGHRFIIEKVLGLTGHDSHYFSSVQWKLPTLEHYTKLQQAFPGYFTREYEDLRRPFSVSADVPYTDVWAFPTVQHYPGKHLCEKPAALLEHIINASTRPGAIILDCFAGSGSTLLAAKNLGRFPIGIEIDDYWVQVAKARLEGPSPPQPASKPQPAQTGQLSLF